MKNVIRLVAVILGSLLLAGFVPRDERSCGGMTQRLMKEGRHEEILLVYDRLIGNSPDSALLHQERAFLLLRMDRKRDAIADFSAIIRLTPDDSTAYISRAFIYSDLGETASADADFRQACALGDPAGCSFAGETPAGTGSGAGATGE